ncbi:MAG: hypothetical protein JW958_04090 [Candidatus Eisenbacteria bacterium]|nr:hypothetical protein [Candidatus Eisenbacteria bacterium]
MRRSVKLALGAAAALAALSLLRAEGPLPEGVRKTDEDLRFTGQDLFGHINGGAEVFYEYGFRDLLVERYAAGDKKLNVETYRMESPEAALAIYLLLRGEETPIEGLGARNSANPYQISAVKGSRFLQVNIFSGDEALLPVAAELARRALASAPEEKEPADLLGRLPEEGRVPGTEMLVRGPYTLQRIYLFGDGDILRLGGRIYGVAARYEESEGDTAVYDRILIDYPGEEEARAAFRNLADRLDPYLEIVREEEGFLVFRDYKDEYGSAALGGIRIELRTGLSAAPPARTPSPILQK